MYECHKYSEKYKCTNGTELVELFTFICFLFYLYVHSTLIYGFVYCLPFI